MLKNKLVILLTTSVLIFFSCTPYNKIDVARSSATGGGPQTIIYSLPKTRIDINIQVTRTTTKAGPYAAYAEKYLTLKNVPVSDSETYEISNISIAPVNEPDPEQFYAITFKTYPSNLDRLFAMTNQGLMLDLHNNWKGISKEIPSAQKEIAFPRSIYEPNIEEKTDTFYKTILTDASFVKVPIYKKSMDIKKEEDKAKDMADLILKLRKRRLKLMMGDYDYHPDGGALKVIVEELGKQEEELMSHFTGIKIKETSQYSFSITPAGPMSKELLWFNPDKGVSESARQGANAVSASVSVKETVATDANAKPTVKSTNSLFFRSPVIAHIQVKTGNTLLAEAKIPVYQAGQVQLLPVMP